MPPFGVALDMVLDAKMSDPRGPWYDAYGTNHLEVTIALEGWTVSGPQTFTLLPFRHPDTEDHHDLPQKRD